MTISHDSLRHKGNVPGHVLKSHLPRRELRHVRFAFSLQLTRRCNLNLIIRLLCLLQRILDEPHVRLTTRRNARFAFRLTRESPASAYQSCKQFYHSTSGEATPGDQSYK